MVYLKISSIRKFIPRIKIKNENLKIKRIRGVSISSKVSTQFLNKMISKTREIFNDYLPDVWIHSDLVKNHSDRFYGLSLGTNTHLNFSHCFDHLSDSVENPEKIAEEVCK